MHIYRSKSILDSEKKFFQRILAETVVGCPWRTHKDKRQTNKSKKSFFYRVCFEAFVIKLASTLFAYFNFLLAIDTYLK